MLVDIIGLTYLPDWEFSVKGLAALYADHDNPGAGIEAVKSTVAELEEARLLFRRQLRGGDGKVSTSIWAAAFEPMTDEEAGELLDEAQGSILGAAGPLPESEKPIAVKTQSDPWLDKPVAVAPLAVKTTQYVIHRKEEQIPLKTPFVTEVSADATELPKLGRTRLNASDLPETLKPVAEQLVLWWNTGKGGSKSQKAYELLLGNLDRIRLEGGIEAVAQQIEKAMLAKRETGQGWKSITHSNWVAYRPRKAAQEAKERQQAAKPSLEQQEALEAAQGRPDLFATAWVNERGQTWVRFRESAHQAAVALRGSYPEVTAAGSLTGLQAEIDFLMMAKQAIKAEHGLDKAVCPF